jgi:hypothetical protein
LGNEYTLINATGMVRKHEAPNLDITHPQKFTEHSTFLLAPPNMKVSASFLFKRTTRLPDSKREILYGRVVSGRCWSQHSHLPLLLTS